MGAVLAYIAHLYRVEKRARRSGIVGEDLRLLREHASMVRAILSGFSRWVIPAERPAR